MPLLRPVTRIATPTSKESGCTTRSGVSNKRRGWPHLDSRYLQELCLMCFTAVQMALHLDASSTATGITAAPGLQIQGNMFFELYST